MYKSILPLYNKSDNLCYCWWKKIGRNPANHLGCIKPCKSWGKTTNLNWSLPDVWTNSISFRGCYFLEGGCQPRLAIFIMRKPIYGLRIHFGWFKPWPFYPRSLEVTNLLKGSRITIPEKVTSRIAMSWGHIIANGSIFFGWEGSFFMRFPDQGKNKDNIWRWISKLFMRCPDILIYWGHGEKQQHLRYQK